MTEPETDHIEKILGNAAHPILSSFCRKLERERDEARKQRDMYQEQADHFLEQWGKAQERMLNAERGLLNSNKRGFTSPYINKTNGQ